MQSYTTNYRSLLIVGVCVPVALATADHAILTRIDIAASNVTSVAVLFVFFALQISFVSWAVARYINPWPLRWVIWIWTMLLIDLQLAIIAAVESFPTREAINCLATGVLAGQVGALVVWGILGSGGLAWRAPALLVLLPIGGNFYELLVRLSHDGSWYQLVWDDLLWVQALILSLLCCALRLSGFTLEMTTPEALAASDACTGSHSLQFGIRDVLIGTTSLAIVLAIAKAGGLLTLQFVQNVYAAGLLFVVLIATCTGAVLLMDLWASLGRGRAMLRTLSVVLASLAFGSPIAWYCVNVGQPRMILNRDYRLFHWYATGYWWIGWMFLAATILAGSLIIFRTLGYRLVRVPRRERFSRRKTTASAVALRQESTAVGS
jgi:hypothetical protein